MKTKNPIPVSFLNPGDKFKFESLSSYRHCEVKRNSEAGTWIEGEVRHGKDGVWKPLSKGHVISNDSRVFLIEENV